MLPVFSFGQSNSVFGFPLKFNSGLTTGSDNSVLNLVGINGSCDTNVYAPIKYYWVDTSIVFVYNDIKIPAFGYSYNVCIGKKAGDHLINEKYCVIVGSDIPDSIKKTFIKRDMVWYVDYNEPLLEDQPELKLMLFTYEERVINTGNDLPMLRKMLNQAITNYYRTKEQY